VTAKDTASQPPPDAEKSLSPDTGHRDAQLERLISKRAVSHNEFEAKTDILSLDEVLQALNEVAGLPPIKALTTLLSRLPFSRIQALVQRALTSRKVRVIDEFGFDQKFLEPLEPIAKWFHDNYFRVESRGLENVADSGRVLLVANHSGTLPYDGAMVVAALRFQHPAQRRVRVLVEDFIYHWPFMGMFMSRVGAVRACQENALRLLENDEATLVFPEGVKGIGKLFSKRYRLQRFGRGGAVRLAAASNAPMVPVAIVGAEESMPLLSKVSWLARPLGLPYIPVTPILPWLGPLGLIPFPTKWTIDFGPPIDLSMYAPGELLKDRVALNRVNEELRAAVQALIDVRLASRKSVLFG